VANGVFIEYPSELHVYCKFRLGGYRQAIVFIAAVNRCAVDMRHFPIVIVAFSYANPSCFPMVIQTRLWPNVSTSIGDFSMAEKLLDKMRRIIRVKHYSAACTSRLAAPDPRSPLDNLA